MEKFCPDILISAVQSRPVLWQESHKDHKNKKIIDKQWDEVGDMCNCSGKMAKSKWKNLKDTYRRINHKITRSVAKSGSIDIKWPYFEMMSFVKTPNEMASSHHTPEHWNESQDFEFSEYCKMSNPKRKTDIYMEEEFVDMEDENVYKQKTVGIERKDLEDNDDMQFFKSLLPFMNNFNAIEKLEIRTEIQNVILHKMKKIKKE